MSLLNRTKNYFLLVCIMMCGFLSLLTWHLLYGTYNLSLLPGADVNANHKSRQINKVRFATRKIIPSNKLQNLATDKHGSKMFKTSNSGELISQKIQSDDKDNLLSFSNQSDLELVKDKIVNEQMEEESGLASKRKIKSQDVSGNRYKPEIKFSLDGLKNKDILNDAWKLYKEITEKFKTKLTSKYSKKVSHGKKDTFSDLNPRLQNMINDSKHDSMVYSASGKSKHNTWDKHKMWERLQKLTEHLASQNSGLLNSLNKSENIGYEHSVVNSSSLNQLMKQHPWLILSNMEKLATKTTTFRPETCENCFNPDFPILIDEKMKCKTDNTGSIDLLILIFSSPANFEVRNVIRNTWGKLCHDPRESTTCLFVIGLSDEIVHNKQIQNESSVYSDILQIGFKDSYMNLTYKTISSLKWVQENCHTTRHVMKTDDDMYINTELIPLMLKAAPISSFVAGHCWGSSRPNRDSLSKWYVSLASFKWERFPPMCSGTGYIMSIDIVKSILLTSKNIPFFHLEDVYIALCIHKLGITPTNLMGFSNMFQVFDPCRYRNEVMTSHHIPIEYLKLYWSDIQKCPPIHISPKYIYIPIPVAEVE